MAAISRLTDQAQLALSRKPLTARATMHSNCIRYQQHQQEGLRAEKAVHSLAPFAMPVTTVDHGVPFVYAVYALTPDGKATDIRIVLDPRKAMQRQRDGCFVKAFGVWRIQEGQTVYIGANKETGVPETASTRSVMLPGDLDDRVLLALPAQRE